VRRALFSLLILAALVAAGIGGYRAGRSSLTLPATAMAKGAEQTTAEPSGPVIYYQDPDGKPFYSLEPRSAPDGLPASSQP